MKRVALATCCAFAGLDVDDLPIPAALAPHGIACEPVVWDDPAADWERFDLVVVRSTWDYTHRRDDFLVWAASLPRLANPEAVLRWNTDKRYLAELREAGVAIVPTIFIEPAQEAMVGLPRTGLVVKPAVSAGSADTERHREIRPALEHVARLQDDGRVAMAQPYLDAVDRAGETALVFFGGAFSHAVRKGPMLTHGRARLAGPSVEEVIEPREPSAAERAASHAVMAVVRERFGDLLYARVDLLPGPAGEPLLLELELTEPSLFLAHAAGAAERLAAAIGARL